MAILDPHTQSSLPPQSRTHNEEMSRFPLRLPPKLLFLSGFAIVLICTLPEFSVVESAAQTDSSSPHSTSEGPSRFAMPPIVDLTNRSQRFPTVEERVKLYMSNWYHPPCKDTEIGRLRYRLDTHPPDPNSSLTWPIITLSNPWERNSNTTLMLDSIVNGRRRFLFERSSLVDCARPLYRFKTGGDWEPNGTLVTESRIERRSNVRTYCTEVISLVDMVMALDSQTPNVPPTPILGQFGDDIGSTKVFAVPLITKFRWATTKENLDKVTGKVQSRRRRGEQCIHGFRPSLERPPEYGADLMPIVWKLSTARHYLPLEKSKLDDIPWQEKKLGILWRGDLTGSMTGDTDIEKCQSNERCKFVFDHASSKLIDVALSSHRGRIGDVVDGIQIVKGRVTMKDIQQYKVILSIEGNDVASGLKWGLLSQSVVLMAPPTRTSWAMEELLEPWVHYVPMHPNGSNAEEMVEWVRDNDLQAQEIAQRATLFINDLVYHPDAANDDAAVREEIARRYHALWR